MIDFMPNTIIHPGRILRNHLDGFGWSQKKLSERSGLTEKLISDILNEKAPISTQTARKLSVTFNEPIEFWMNVEMNYETDLERIKRRQEAMLEVDLLDKNDYATLAKLGWLRQVSEPIMMVINLQDYFGTSSLRQIKTPNLVNFRKSGKKQDIRPLLVAAWLRQGERRVEQYPVNGRNGEPDFTTKNMVRIKDFDAVKLRDSVPRIKSLSRCDDFAKAIEKVQGILNEVGVFLFPLSSIPRTNINGSVRWSGEHPIIQISDRGKRDDIFWFTLLHEIGHILLHSRKEEYIDYDEYVDMDKKELEANNFAEEALITNKTFREFCTKCNGRFSEAVIMSFSEKMSVAPSIVVGRLKKDKYIRQSEFSRLHKKIEFSSFSHA